MSQAFDIALPSFLLEKDNQIFMLAALFITVVMFPIAFLASRKNTNDLSDLEFDNGIIK